MFRKFLSQPAFDSLAANGFNISNIPVCVQSVRWRKPRWVPQAKSKVFRVPERKLLPEEEAAEWLRINQNYK
jgi:Mitochondrial ribosome subunit S26